jgi:hypothetical protein
MIDEPPSDPRKTGRAGRRAGVTASTVTPPTEAGQALRQARLAGALRDNLRRRKAQSRARRPAGGGPPSDEG